MCSRLVPLAACLVAVSFAQFAPLYAPCGPTVGCVASAVCQASVCVPAAAPMMPVAPMPVAPVPAPVIGCATPCLAGAACVAGACQCAAPAVVYSPVVGCAPPPPPAPMPVVAGRLIPQALPGAPCEPGVECTGGSVCSLGVCLCPPELVQEGTVCVLRQVYGVVPPPVVPVPVMPVAPVALLAPGAPCAAPTACVQGALCSAGVCQCSPAFAPVQGACVRRKHKKQAERQ